MKKMFKVAAAGILAASVATAGFLSQQPLVAEAGLLGGLGGAITKGVLKNGANIDIEGLSNRQAKMLEHLYYSVALMQTASENAVNGANGNHALQDIVKAKSVANSLQGNETGINGFKDSADKTTADLQNAKASYQNLISEGDEAKLKQVDGMVKASTEQRLISDTIAGYAAIEAGKILKATLPALKNPGANADKINALIKTAKHTNDLLKVRSKLSKNLSAATQAYRKARDIPEDKDAAKKTADNLSAPAE